MHDQAAALKNESYYADLMQKAAAQIAALRAELQTLKAEKAEPIAIIGLACRFPGGADRPERFWRILHEGIDAIRAAPTDRWEANLGMHDGGFLQEVDQFDAEFFNISAREAVKLDPQQRLLLEVSWEALERAGVAPSSLFNSATGVFIGICSNDYGRVLLQAAPGSEVGFQREPHPALEHDLYLTTGNAASVAAGRLAYFLGLTGPCLAVDTACSSSLVAAHLACQSLRNRECNLALAGGVNLILQPDYTLAFANAGMLAADARCKTFAAAANGFVRSEGCGMVVLKRLADALADGDTILALLRGTAISQDGASGGLTIPSGAAQVHAIRQALTHSHVEPAQVQYIEAHGTGTALGDPIEMDALRTVFQERSEPLWVGSVKTNIGHTEAAAGIAGLIKVVLALQHGEIPPNLHFDTPNPYIDWTAMPVQIPTKPMPWPAGPRIAGVSSFGFSGTNAHVLVEEAPPPHPNPLLRREGTVPPLLRRGGEHTWHLLTLSAKSEAALQALAQRYREHLASHPELALADVCYSANTGRSHFAHRLSVTASSTAQLQDQLAAVRVREPFGRGHGEHKPGVSQGYAPIQTHTKLVGGPLGALLSSGLGAGHNDWQQMLENLGALYVRGAMVDWDIFDRDYHAALNGDAKRYRRRRKVELPTYPFQRQRYWVEGPRQSQQAPERATPAWDDWLYAIEWQARPLVCPAPTEQGRHWLIFADGPQRAPAAGLGTGEALAMVLAAHGDIVSLVYPDHEGRPPHPQPLSVTERGATLPLSKLERGLGGEVSGLHKSYVIAPDSAEAYQQILQAAPAQAVVYLWSLDTPYASTLTTTTVQTAAQRICSSVLFLIQALAQTKAPSSKLWLVTRGAVACPAGAGPSQTISDGPVPGLAQAPLWGMGKVIALEHPEVWGGLIDLSPARAAGNRDEAALLWAALTDPAGEDQMALRNETRYVARLAPTPAKQQAAYQIRQDGTYLITGGFGYLGLSFAQWLRAQGAPGSGSLSGAQLVLVGRSAPSPEAQATITQLQQQGQVLVLQADVADKNDMARVFAACAALPPLRGIMHAAGITPYRVLQEMQPEELAAVFRAKISGAWLLHEQTRQLPLDFFVCCSSAGSVWGAKGQAHYAAANHFLDSLAHYRRSLGLPALTVNWGLLAGQRLASRDYFQWLTQIGMQDMAPQDGCQAMAYLLGVGATQALVAAMDWPRFTRVYEVKGPRPLLKTLPVQSTAPNGGYPLGAPMPSPVQGISEQLQVAQPNKREALLIAYLQKEVAGVLHTAQLPVLEQGFFEMGLDSLMTVELAARLSTGLGMAVPSSAFFNFPTIRELANYVHSALFSPPLSGLEVGQAGPNRSVVERLETMPNPDRLAYLQQLAEHELAALIDQKLTQFEGDAL